MSNWKAFKDVVARALDLPLAERSAFLSKNCADQRELQEAISLATYDRSKDETHLLDPRADAFMGLAGTNPAGLVGRKLGKYTLLRLVGQGGMGAVYLARQRGVDRNVAVKVVPPHALIFDARSRFEREMQALGRIDHPGVARVYDFGLHVETNRPRRRPSRLTALGGGPEGHCPLHSAIVPHSHRSNMCDKFAVVHQLHYSRISSGPGAPMDLGSAALGSSNSALNTRSGAATSFRPTTFS